MVGTKNVNRAFVELESCNIMYPYGTIITMQIKLEFLNLIRVA